MKKILVIAVVIIGFVLIGCDKKVPGQYYIYSKSEDGKTFKMEYALDNRGKETRIIDISGMYYQQVDFEFYMGRKSDFPISVWRTQSSEPLVLYVGKGNCFDIDGKRVDVADVFHHANKGETLDGIGVDSVFSYLKRRKVKGYYEMQPNEEFITFQME